MIINAKIIEKEVNPETYHNHTAERCTKDYKMSYSSLKDFAQCPAKYKAGIEEEKSDSMLFGSLIDCLLLTPNQFDSRYAIQPATYVNKEEETKPWNWNSNTCKKWREENKDKTIITTDKIIEAQRAIARLKEDEAIMRFIEQSDKQVWIGAEWKDEDTGLVIPLRALIDLLPREDSEFSLSIADVKTARDASPIEFNRAVYNMKYHVQSALYLDLVNELFIDKRDTCCLIVIENKLPYQYGRRILHPDYIEMGRNEYTRSLQDYCKCLQSGFFPGYDDSDESVDGWGTCFPEPWMEGRDAFKTKYLFK